MQIRRVAGALGAEIIGVDLRDPELDFDAVYRAFLEHQVIFFRGVHLTEEEQLALGRRFGTPSIYPVMRVLGATEPTMRARPDRPRTLGRRRGSVMDLEAELVISCWPYASETVG